MSRPVCARYTRFISVREHPAILGAHFSNALTKPLPASPCCRNTPRRIFASHRGDTLHLPRERRCSTSHASIPASARFWLLFDFEAITTADSVWLRGNSRILILGGEHASYLVFESLPSADEFTTVRKPCTLSESGFLRGSDWALRTFILVPWKMGLTSYRLTCTLSTCFDTICRNVSATGKASFLLPDKPEKPEGKPPDK